MKEAGVIEICYCQQKMAEKQKSMLDTIAGRQQSVCMCVYVFLPVYVCRHVKTPILIQSKQHHH